MSCIGSCIGRIIFIFAIVVTTLPVWIIARILLFIACICPGFLPTVHKVTKVLLGWAWWLMLKLCCCILCLRSEGLSEFQRGVAACVAAKKPCCVISNHISFLDAIIALASMPSSAAAVTKSMGSAHLMAMPVLGGLFQAMGFFAVPFKSHDTKKAKVPEGEEGGSIADFSVDKVGIAKVMDEFKEWVGQGNVGTWAPEGRLNPNPDVLQTFRAGGFNLVLEVDSEIWCMVLAGVEVFWHRKAAVGGAPSNVGVKNFKLCSSSFELIKELTNGDDTMDKKEKAVLIANYAQKKIQEKRDELVMEGWVSLLPRAKGDSGTALVEAGAAGAAAAS